MRKLTLNKIMKAVKSDKYLGFCTACGAKAYGVEPDARGYKCEKCGKNKVYGAEELLLMYV